MNHMSADSRNAISKRSVFRQSVDLTRLATPMIMARGGIMLMVTADMVMVAHYSVDEVAYLALGSSIVMPMIVVGLGLLMGTLVMVANAFGAGRFSACGQALRNALPYAVMLGVLGYVLTLFGHPALLAFGQSPEMALKGAEVMRVLGYGLPAFFVFLAAEFFLEGVRRPVPAMVAMLVANLINIALNSAFIFGHFGAPEMGAAGAAWATTISRCFAAMCLVVFVWNMAGENRYAVRSQRMQSWRTWRDQRRIGYATSLSIGAESCAFALMHIFAGWLGTLALAAFSITFNIITMVFMLAVGFGTATAVSVGNAFGHGDLDRARTCGWVGLGTNSAVMAGIGLVLVLVPGVIAELFTDDVLLIGAAAPLIAFTVYLLVVDGGQAVMSNALRGRKDVWYPCSIQLFSYVAVMLPVAHLLAFGAGFGVLGLFYGFLVASSTSAVLLIWRYHHLSCIDRRNGAPISTTNEPPLTIGPQ